MKVFTKNVGIKSQKLYTVSSLYRLVYDLSLIEREYKSGKSIYILKCIITYYRNGVEHKKVFKKVYYTFDTALRAYWLH